MKNLPALLASAVCTCFLGCATTPTTVSTNVARPPEQIVQSLNVKKLSARADPDVVYGLAALKDHLRPAAERCRADGGEMVVLGRSMVQFAPKVDGQAGARQAQLLLPTKLACRTSAALAWGADVRYGDSTFFPSQWAGEVYYYTGMQFGFLPGDYLERTEASSASNREAARKASDECSALRQTYNDRLRTRPAVGMNVAFGLIIELKPPLALVQYDALGQKVKGREQEWVQMSSLSAGSECPR